MGTTKKRFIELYGEEAWEIEKEKRKKYNREYYLNNSENLIQKQKEYNDTNRERINEKRREYNRTHQEELKEHYQKNKDKYREWHKEYYENNKERIREYNHTYYKEYYLKNKEKKSEYKKQRYETKEGRAQVLFEAYRKFDRNKGLQGFNLSSEYIATHIFNSSCVYCGESDWHKLGCDRIDNTKAHTPDNVVCACASCNAQRSDKWTVEEFKLKRQEELNSN